MAAIEDDFAAYTTIGERVAVPSELRKPVQSRTAGPSFALDPHLEPFILLSKSARGAAAAGLVEKATAAPAVYVFAELLQQPSIKDLANQEQHVKSYRLLKLFAYGTWADYNDHRDQYPQLSREQETKLKHLTILSLAATSRILPYSTLLSTLSLDSVPQLEDVLIELFYANVLTGRLDQKHERLQVISARGRDVHHVPVQGGDGGGEQNAMQVDQGNPTAATAAAATATPTTASLHTILSSWQTTLLNLIRSLESHLGAIHADQVNAAHSKLQHEERVKAVVSEVVPAAGGGKGGKGKAQSAGGGGLWKAAGGFGGQGAGAAGVGMEGAGTAAAAGVEADETTGMMDLDDAADTNDANDAAAAAGGGGGGGGGGGAGSGSMGRTRKRGRI